MFPVTHYKANKALPSEAMPSLITRRMIHVTQNKQINTLLNILGYKNLLLYQACGRKHLF